MSPLKQLKVELGITYVGMCHYLGEPLQYQKSLINIVNGKRPVPSKRVVRWSAITGIPGWKLRPDMYPQHATSEINRSNDGDALTTSKQDTHP